jgi:hypothetical protein
MGEGASPPFFLSLVRQPGSGKGHPPLQDCFRIGTLRRQNVCDPQGHGFIPLGSMAKGACSHLAKLAFPGRDRLDWGSLRRALVLASPWPSTTCSWMRSLSFSGVQAVSVAPADSRTPGSSHTSQGSVVRRRSWLCGWAHCFQSSSTNWLSRSRWAIWVL